MKPGNSGNLLQPDAIVYKRQEWKVVVVNSSSMEFAYKEKMTSICILVGSVFSYSVGKYGGRKPYIFGWCFSSFPAKE